MTMILIEALTEIARLRTELSGDFSMGSRQSDIARKALAEWDALQRSAAPGDGLARERSAHDAPLPPFPKATTHEREPYS